MVFADRYLPGFKSGGPIRSLSNLVETLGSEFLFRIVTRDRDNGDSGPYPGTMPHAWQRVGAAQVLYLSPGQLFGSSLRRIMNEMPHALLYLNSFFSPAFTIRPLVMRRLGLTRRVPWVLAPRGEFSPKALALKSARKKVYLTMASTLALCRDVTWQASSAYEEADIRRWLGPHAPVLVAPDVFTPRQDSFDENRITKTPGTLKVVFLSRISPMKNLAGALKILSRASGTIEFNIYGPIAEPDYWRACQSTISSLPSNVRAEYHGPVPNEEVIRVVRQHHLFFLPTLGENFGHAILEALTAGRPVLISDRSPWRDLVAQKAGWDIPLERLDLFQAVLNKCVAMDDNEFSGWARKAREFTDRHRSNDRAIELNRVLFRAALAAEARELIAQ